MCLRLSYISLAALYQLAVTTTHNQIIHAPKCFFCDVMVDFHWHEIGWGESHWVGSWQQSLENKETQKFWISWECRSPLVLAPSRPIFALQSPWDLGQHFGPWLHGIKNSRDQAWRHCQFLWQSLAVIHRNHLLSEKGSGDMSQRARRRWRPTMSNYESGCRNVRLRHGVPRNRQSYFHAAFLHH